LTISAGLGHKNLPRLLEAFAQLPGDTLLVVAGLSGLEGGELERRAAAAGLGERVRFTGWLPLADLEGFYALARVFVYPTLLEGFGLPLLEAMRREVPVACSDIPVLREVAGDEAAEFFDPYSPDAIAAALRRLLADDPRRRELVAAGRARWPQFTWERTARETLAVYDRALRTSRQ
jgi:glycosyltransferase involved in cell wall biosynthesis